MREHDWQHLSADAETMEPAKKGVKRETGRITLTWRCALCGAESRTSTGTQTITTPRPTADSARAQGVDPDCDQETVNQVHLL